MVRPKVLAILLWRWMVRRRIILRGDGPLLGTGLSAFRRGISEAADRRDIMALGITPHTAIWRPKYGQSTHKAPR